MKATTFLTLAALSLAAPASAGRFEDLQLVYHATFANGSLESGVDPLNIGPLTFGTTGEPGSNPSWTPSQGDYLVQVSTPASTTGPPILAAIVATPVNFDVGSVVGLRGTFVAPVGPHNSGDTWAVTVDVRTGGANPLIRTNRAAATLLVTANAARLNTPGASTPANLPSVPQAVYDAIFDPVDPQPFTIEMLVDRKAGRGEARLKVGEAVFSRTYEFAVFRADSGPAITTVGAYLALDRSPGPGTVSVRMRDFQIFTSKRNAASGDTRCPPEFGCRLAPPTKAN